MSLENTMLVDCNYEPIQKLSNADVSYLAKFKLAEFILQDPLIAKFILPKEYWLELFLNRHEWEITKSIKKHIVPFVPDFDWTIKLYGNIVVLHPEGFPMFHCGINRAIWYLERDKAKIISNDPQTIQLTFIPNGQSNHE